jgi:PiT family inorganic phosphate transporter
MGIMAAVLYIDASIGKAIPESLPIPLWVVLAAHTAIGLGTLTGGWRIVHTLGSRITKLQPVGGFAAESSAAITLFTTAHLGIPVSTTHTITGAVVGVGTTKRFSAVRWGLTGRVIYAWLLTIPGSALIAALAYGAFTVVPGEAVALAGLAAAASMGVLLISRRRREAVLYAPP